MLPRSGDVLRITRAASVQFSVPFDFRLIRIHDWSTYDGWLWLDGYQLNAAWDATERRSIFVQIRGLQKITVPFGRAAAAPAVSAPRTPATRTGRLDRVSG